MKKILFFPVGLLLGGAMILLNSCKKEDNTAPVVVINGEGSMRISLNGVFTDPGAYAQDDMEGSIVVISDASLVNPNTNLEGTYTIHYYATDNAGNSGKTERTVIVANDAAKFDTIYNVNDNVTGKNPGNFTYKVTVTHSTTVNNQLFLRNFSGLGGSVTVTALVNDTTVYIQPSPQRPLNMTDPGVIFGTGKANSKRITKFNYTIDYDSGINDQGVSTWN